MSILRKIQYRLGLLHVLDLADINECHCLFCRLYPKYSRR